MLMLEAAPNLRVRIAASHLGVLQLSCNLPGNKETEDSRKWFLGAKAFKVFGLRSHTDQFDADLQRAAAWY
jgi:hypothetical protein